MVNGIGIERLVGGLRIGDWRLALTMGILKKKIVVLIHKMKLTLVLEIHPLVITRLI